MKIKPYLLYFTTGFLALLLLLSSAMTSSQAATNASPALNVSKYTNGIDADDPNGSRVPQLAIGETVVWTYRVTNLGDTSVPRSEVSVTDNQPGVVPVFSEEEIGNGDDIFDPGEEWIYTATGTAINLTAPPAGVITVPDVCTRRNTLPASTAYVNLATVTIPGATATDPSSYCGKPGIEIVKYTNDMDAKDPDGSDVPQLAIGDPVVWTYKVTNTGNTAIPKADVIVTDNQPGVTPVFDQELSGNGDEVLDPGEEWLYKAAGTAIDLTAPPPDVITVPDVCTLNGTQPPSTAYVNQGMVSIPGDQSTDSSSYCNPQPSITITKFTNGQDAKDPDGPGVPEIPPGQPVIWTYEVTNTGGTDIPMSDITVTDNVPGVNPAFDTVKTGNTDDILEPGEVWIYRATGVALELEQSSLPNLVPDACRQGNLNAPGKTTYTNQGKVTIPGDEAVDSSSYCNPSEYTLYAPIVLGSVIPCPDTWGMAVGFEDVRQGLGLIDYDYNDWLAHIHGKMKYDNPFACDLGEIDFLINPSARGAQNEHTFHIRIPSNTFASDGEYTLTLYDQNNSPISVDNAPFSASTDTDLVIFSKTSEVFPDLTNTIESLPRFTPAISATLTMTFDHPFTFVFDEMQVDAHGNSLFFDPYLELAPGEHPGWNGLIHQGDENMLTVPEPHWEWAEETWPICEVYDPTYVFFEKQQTGKWVLKFEPYWWLQGFNTRVYGDGISSGQRPIQSLTCGVDLSNTTPP